MWATVLVLAGSVIFEPIRLGLVIALLGRRRPLLQLLVFCCGGLAMGVGVGTVVLFALGTAPVVGRLTVAEVQVAAGIVALLMALALATSVQTTSRSTPSVKPAARWRSHPGPGAVGLLERPRQGAPTRVALADHARRYLGGDSLYVAGVGGMAAALPSANYMAAMGAILAAHAAPLTQTQALLAFNAVAFTMAELPLVGCLVAPRRTIAAAAALQTWLRSRSRRDVAALAAFGGAVLLTVGLTHL